jgi:hypothetical protein
VPLVEKELSTHPEHLSSLLMLVGSCYYYGATSREGTVYPSRANEFTPDVSGFVLLLRVPLVEKELSTHPEHLSSLPPDVSGPLVEKELSTYPEQMSSLLMLVGSCYYHGCH